MHNILGFKHISKIILFCFFSLALRSMQEIDSNKHEFTDEEIELIKEEYKDLSNGMYKDINNKKIREIIDSIEKDTITPDILFLCDAFAYLLFLDDNLDSKIISFMKNVENKLLKLNYNVEKMLFTDNDIYALEEMTNKDKGNFDKKFSSLITSYKKLKNNIMFLFHIYNFEYANFKSLIEAKQIQEKIIHELVDVINNINNKIRQKEMALELLEKKHKELVFEATEDLSTFIILKNKLEQRRDYLQNQLSTMPHHSVLDFWNIVSSNKKNN